MRIRPSIHRSSNHFQSLNFSYDLKIHIFLLCCIQTVLLLGSRSSDMTKTNTKCWRWEYYPTGFVVRGKLRWRPHLLFRSLCQWWTWSSQVHLVGIVHSAWSLPTRRKKRVQETCRIARKHHAQSAPNIPYPHAGLSWLQPLPHFWDRVFFRRAVRLKIW